MKFFTVFGDKEVEFADDQEQFFAVAVFGKVFKLWRVR